MALRRGSSGPQPAMFVSTTYDDSSMKTQPSGQYHAPPPDFLTGHVKCSVARDEPDVMCCDQLRATTLEETTDTASYQH